MADENGVVCMLGAMDRLWFHKIVLFSEPSLFLFFPANDKTPLRLPTSESIDELSKQSSQMSVMSEQEISSVGSVISSSQEDETSSRESIDLDKESRLMDRPKRPNLSSRKTRYHSSSPISAAKKQSRNLHYPAPRLQKSMSCKNLAELELKEVKGFMDLGFIFKKESLSDRMMSLIPGLQRLSENEEEKDLRDNDFDCFNDDFEDEEEEKIMRPYLSEAWIIKRPDSPLLNLRVPRASTTADMKKHLKYWARTVASAIQLES